MGLLEQFCGTPETSTSADAAAVRVVLRALRSLDAAYEYCDPESWSSTWRSFCAEFGTRRAWLLCGELQLFLHALRRSRTRSLDLLCFDCPYMSKDETLVIELLLGDDTRRTQAAAKLAGKMGNEGERAVRVTSLVDEAAYFSSALETWCPSTSGAALEFVMSTDISDARDALPCTNQPVFGFA